MRRIIIIEDEKIVINGIKAMLKRISEQYQVIGSATDGIAGFDLLLREKPDIVLCDIRIPGMDGLSLIESVKPLLSDTVFVVMSGFREYEYAKKALSLGVVEYIEKPVTIPKLAVLMEKISRSETVEEDRGRFEELMKAVLKKIRNNEYSNLTDYTDELIRIKRNDELTDYKSDLFRFVCVVSTVFYEENAFGKRMTPHLPSLSNMEILSCHEDVNTYVQVIMRDIIRKMSKGGEKAMHKGIRQLLDYIDANYSKDIGLTELSDLVHMNQAYLSVLFKEEVGMSFIKYLTQIRIEKAKELLADNYKNTEVCRLVGYQNYPYFCEIFKKETGKTPGEFRNLKRG